MSYLYEMIYLTSALIKKRKQRGKKRKDKQNKPTLSATNIEHEQNHK